MLGKKKEKNMDAFFKNWLEFYSVLEGISSSCVPAWVALVTSWLCGFKGLSEELPFFKVAFLNISFDSWGEIRINKISPQIAFFYSCFYKFSEMLNLFFASTQN